jgi:DNA-binding GntR family transcriptional regulator
MQQNRLAGLPKFSEERRTAHQSVRDTLRRAILSGTLSGGTRLVQADIAAQLKVSTTPVREALRDLAAEGLILFDPHRGAIVHELDLSELVEVYEIRKALESLAVRKATQRINDEQLAAAAALQDTMDGEHDPGAWVELNWQFHSLLERAANSPRLWSMVKTVQDAAAIYVGHSLKVEPQRMAAGNREHWAMLEAMRRRDSDKAVVLLVQHLDATLGAVLASHSLEGDADVLPRLCQAATFAPDPLTRTDALDRKGAFHQLSYTMHDAIYRVTAVAVGPFRASRRRRSSVTLSRPGSSAAMTASAADSSG